MLDELAILPSLIFMGVGAMTDFGPLLANPSSLLLGAAAQLGIYVAFTIAMLSGEFTPEEAASIAIIGGADGPTAIFLTGKLAPHLLGSIAVAAYSYMENFTFGNLSSLYLNGISDLRYTTIPSQIPDNLTWETARTTDFGVDASFLNGKINFTGDYYIRKSYDMFTPGPSLPDTYGASAPKGNYADMNTYGYELSLSYDDSFDVAGYPLNLGVKASLADSRSFIQKYNNPTGDLGDYYVGQEVGEIWGYVCNGLFRDQEQIDNYYGPGDPYVNTKFVYSDGYIINPGDMILEDLNGNKIIDSGANTVTDSGDRRIIGNRSPRYHYSFSLNLAWRGIYASAFFQGIGKQDWYPSSESPFWGQYNRPYNQALKWMIGNYWTEDNKDAYLPRYSGYYGPLYSGAANSRYLQNAAYLRLQNLQIGYNLPEKWIKKMFQRWQSN